MMLAELAAEPFRTVRVPTADERNGQTAAVGSVEPNGSTDPSERA
jgi:hypothetical protein